MQVKTSIIQSIYHTNSQSELRLDPGRVYSGNLRLVNLGCVTNSATKKMYNLTSGVYSLIRNIYLYDGNTLLDQITDAHHLFGFRNLQKGNAYNFNINQQLSGTTNTYQIQKDLQDANIRNKSIEMINVDPDCFATNDAETTFKGWLNLQTHFPFLANMVYNLQGQNMQFVDTNVFKNFRIVIEWRSTAEIVSCFQGTSTGVTATILSPLLVCDEFIGLKLPQQLNFMYDSYEVDKVLCNTQTKARVNGFNGKFVKKLLLMNINPAELTDSDANNINPVKADYSETFNDEVIQLLVNGKTLFDYNGINTSARKLSMLTDSWGELCLPPGSYDFEIDVGDDGTILISGVQGQLSYGGCLVDQRVSELAVEYSKPLDFNFLLYFWGEVVKQIQINNGQYNVSYA